MWGPESSVFGLGGLGHLSRHTYPLHSEPSSWQEIIAQASPAQCLEGLMAASEQPGLLRAGVGAVLLRPFHLLVAGSTAGRARRGPAGARVHHLSRLRPRLVLRVAAGQRLLGLHHRRADLHALLPLALANTPSTMPRSGDLDRRGIGDVWTMTVQEYLDVVALEAVRLPAGAQSVRAVRHGAAVPVPGPGSAFPTRQASRARAALGVLDEPGAAAGGRRHDLGLRLRGLLGDPTRQC